MQARRAAQRKHLRLSARERAPDCGVGEVCNGLREEAGKCTHGYMRGVVMFFISVCYFLVQHTTHTNRNTHKHVQNLPCRRRVRDPVRGGGRPACCKVCVCVQLQALALSLSDRATEEAYKLVQWLQGLTFVCCLPWTFVRSKKSKLSSLLSIP